MIAFTSSTVCLQQGMPAAHRNLEASVMGRAVPQHDLLHAIDGPTQGTSERTTPQSTSPVVDAQWWPGPETHLASGRDNRYRRRCPIRQPVAQLRRNAPSRCCLASAAPSICPSAVADSKFRPSGRWHPTDVVLHCGRIRIRSLSSDGRS